MHVAKRDNKVMYTNGAHFSEWREGKELKKNVFFLFKHEYRVVLDGFLLCTDEMGWIKTLASKISTRKTEKESPTFRNAREDRDIKGYVVHFHWQCSFFSVHLICLHSNVKNNPKNISSQSVQKREEKSSCTRKYKEERMG